MTRSLPCPRVAPGYWGLGQDQASDRPSGHYLPYLFQRMCQETQPHSPLGQTNSATPILCQPSEAVFSLPEMGHWDPFGGIHYPFPSQAHEASVFSLSQCFASSPYFLSQSASRFQGTLAFTEQEPSLQSTPALPQEFEGPGYWLRA